MRLAGALLGIFAISAALGQPSAAHPKWKMQFFYDKLDSTLSITDLKFPSSQRGIAIGIIEDKKKAKPTAIVTADGGVNWALVPLPEPGLSIFFFDESLGWMVTAKGIWQSLESGRSWKKISDLKNADKVYFVDAMRGFAIGSQKLAWETTDGGKTWTELAATKALESNPDWTNFTAIDFATTKAGIIVGNSTPPRRGAVPDWMSPGQAAQREWPTLTISLQTVDGGKTWNTSTAPLFGLASTVHLARDGNGLVLFEFRNTFEWPSEAYRIDLRTGKSTRAFREKDRLLTDCAVFPEGRAMLAGVERVGQGTYLPVPTKLRMYQTTNLTDWTSVDVDYRAVATRVFLSALDMDHAWIATDTGMILKLEP